jgi:hypothetical protein
MAADRVTSRNEDRVTSRNEQDDYRMSVSIHRLSMTMDNIRNCKDIDALDREIRNLLLLTKLNKDIWNWEKYDNDLIVLGVRLTVFGIPNLIEKNPNISFDFKAEMVSDTYRRIKGNIRKVFHLLNMNIDVEIKMETDNDIDFALDLHKRMNNGLESLEQQRKSEEERMRKILEAIAKKNEDERRINDMQKSIQEYWENAKDENERRTRRLQESLDKCKQNIADIDKCLENVGILSDDEGFAEDSGDDIEYEEVNDT